MMNSPWANESREALQAWNVSEEGLSLEEAVRRLKEHGPNEIRGRGRVSRFSILFAQFRSPLIIILMAAAVGTIVLKEWVETWVILGAVAVNTVLGFWQEHKAETVFELLKSYVRTRARVRRDGHDTEIDAVELVPGDIIRVAQGDRIPADARLIFVNNFEADEAVLTGESLPIKKGIASVAESADLGDRTSMIWSGTLATGGFADAVVIATGKDTEIGKIAESLLEAEEQTPLRKAVSRLALGTGALVLFATTGIFIWNLLLRGDIFEAFLLSVSIAVSAVPEGLPVALTVILAVGAERIGKKKGVVRKLLAAETLGSTSIILTDKTGTLTRGVMSLEDVLPREGGKDAVGHMLSIALLNTDVAIENPEADPSEWKLFGRGIETALVAGAAARGIKAPEVRAAHKILDKLPFTSLNKFSATVTHAGGHTRLALLGAPDFLFEHSHLSEAEKKSALAEMDRLAYAGNRVVGVAVKELHKEDEKIPLMEEIKGMTFLGYLIFRDPLREDVGAAIKMIGAAGVRTVIVTGDHRGTAESIAMALDLSDGRASDTLGVSNSVLTGHELREMTDAALAARKEEIAVYARVSPEDKVRIAKMYRAHGEVVAMIGDGVNDAPALKEADIGVSVGSGTDVAKSAADLVLLDDSFSTLVAAIAEGRKILGNIRKVIVYLLSNVADSLFLIGGAMLTGLPLPLSALQILFVNFFTDSFPAIAYAFEEGVDPLGKRPRQLHKNLLDVEMRFLILVVGILTSAMLFFLYFFLLKAGYEVTLVRTFLFAAFATYTLFLSFALRSLERPIWRYNPFSNLYLVVGSGIGLTLTFLAVYLPSLQSVFDTVPLPLPWLLGVIGMGVVNIAGVELGKWLYRE